MGTWTGPHDSAGDRLRAEHAMTADFGGDELVLEAGHEGLLPPWPPTVNLPGLMVPLSAEPVLDRAVCAGCGTVIARRDGSWRHDLGLVARDGCMDARPSV